MPKLLPSSLVGARPNGDSPYQYDPLAAALAVFVTIRLDPTEPMHFDRSKDKRAQSRFTLLANAGAIPPRIPNHLDLRSEQLPPLTAPPPTRSPESEPEYLSQRERRGAAIDNESAGEASPSAWRNAVPMVWNTRAISAGICTMTTLMITGLSHRSPMTQSECSPHLRRSS